MLTFKDEDLGLTYTVETIEDLESAIRLHQAIHHTMQEASADLKVRLTDVVKNIRPIQTPFMGARQIYPSSFTNGLGAGKSIEQGDEALPLHGTVLDDDGLPLPTDSSQWLSPRQISEPPKGSPDAETEALAEAYQLQEHRQLQSEVQHLRTEIERFRTENRQLFKDLAEIEKANKAIPSIEFIGQQAPTESFESICGRFNTGLTLADELVELQKARASLNHFNLDTSGIDKMLAQHGIHYHSAPKHFVGPGLGEMVGWDMQQQAAYAPGLTLQQTEQQAKTQMVKEQLESILALNHAPSKADVRMFQLWERFLEIMDANGFGDTPGEDRTSPDSYLTALEKWLNAFVQASEQLQEERRKSAHLLHEKENCQRQVQVFGAQADGMRNELGECKTEIIALKKGISKLQKKRDSLKSKHESELTEAISNHELCKAELKRIGDLYREMQDQRDQERKMREDAINDNIELSKRSNVLQKKLDYCLKVVPTLEAAWQNIQLGVSAPT